MQRKKHQVFILKTDGKGRRGNYYYGESVRISKNASLRQNNFGQEILRDG